jgi:hypothetical protein
MSLTLTWQTLADLDLYLTAASCADIYSDGACQLLEVSDATTGSSEAITRAVQSGEQFKMWVDNFSGTPQSYTVQVTIQ